MVTRPEDPLAGLPRHGPEALGQCALCHRPILQTGLPLFYRVEVIQCGVDAQALQQLGGLAMMMGGGSAGLALASTMGAHADPVVEMGRGATNLCMQCSQSDAQVMTVVAAAQERS